MRGVSLRSRRLEVVAGSWRKKERVHERETREGRGSRVSSSRAPVLSCAHYFQAPATQAKRRYPIETLGFSTKIVSKQQARDQKVIRT